MEEYYRGDTLIFPFTLENENEEAINYEVGDIVKCGIKSNIYVKKYTLFKELTINKETPEIIFEFDKDETNNIDLGEHVLELELTRGGIVNTIYQDEIKIKGDVVRNESNT